MKPQYAITTFLLLIFITFTTYAETKVTWNGHATFTIETPKGNVLMIDPWLNNPKNPDKSENSNPVEKVSKLNYILLTHGHFDHVADAAALAKNTGARLVAQPELGKQMAKLKGYPKDQMGFDSLMNMGGSITLADGEVTVTMTDAKHSAGLDNPFADKSDQAVASVYAGTPAGFVISIQNGPSIYHSGDTAYFSDMTLIGEMNPDLALISAGDHFTMGPKMAARAAKSVNTKVAVPMHWGTFGILAQDMGPFQDHAKALGVKYRVIAPGDTLVYIGKNLK